MFGFADFSTTKDKSHQEDAEEGVFKQFIRKREYRQFMNKKPGLRGLPGQEQGRSGRDFAAGESHDFM